MGLMKKIKGWFSPDRDELEEAEEIEREREDARSIERGRRASYGHATGWVPGQFDREREE
jgi:hypothetical protein